MRTLSITFGAAIAALTLAGAGGASAQTPRLITSDGGAPGAQLLVGRDILGGDAFLQKAQFLFSGRNYCWYESGWRGPGYYWCGYAFRRGLGWGGPVGWNGWGRGGAGYHGGGGFRGGGHSGGHVGGGFHGGGGSHGGGHMGGGHAGGGHAGGGHAGGGHGGGGHHH